MKKILLFFAGFFFVVSVAKASTEVSSFNELKSAIESGESNISITSDFSFSDSIVIDGTVKITGNNKKIDRDSSYLNKLFNIGSNGSLEISNLSIDGLAPEWQMDVENRYYINNNEKNYVRFPTINGDNDVIANESIFYNSGSLTLNKVTVQNVRCTVEGCLIRGSGNNTISNSRFEHIGSAKGGGSMYIRGGTTKITNSAFDYSVCGVGNVNDCRGGAIDTDNLDEFELNEVEFIDCLAQLDGGALYLRKHSSSIKNSTFKASKVGNDGAAISIDNTTEGKTFEISGTTFDGNIGYAYANGGQSLGVIYLRNWKNKEETPINIKNSIFKNNRVSGGHVLADMVHDAHVSFDNIEVFDNYANCGGIYVQGSYYYVNKSKFYDNKGINGTVACGVMNRFNITDSEIYNNETESSGAAIYGEWFKSKLINTKFYNNKSGDMGGAIYYKGGYTTIESGTVITNNTAKEGGGIFIHGDKGGILRIMEGSRIYNNHAELGGDDFGSKPFEGSVRYVSLYLLDGKNMQVPGIDSWYFDAEGSRYKDIDIPETFAGVEKYKLTESLYLKAGGIGTLDYDLLGGKNDDIHALTVKYGVPFLVDKNVPVKEGYTFKGWSTKADGSGSWFNAGDTYDGTEGLVLYAQYVQDPVNPVTKTGAIIMFLVILILSVFMLWYLKHLEKRRYYTNSL